jgi:hypothetical protein
MTDLKISELSSNGTLDGTELIPLVQSGGNVKALLSAVKTFIIDGLLSASTAATTYLTIANSRYQFVSNSGTTYTVPASAVTANGNTIIELSNNSLTSITINAATATGKTAGDSVTIHITGTYAAQLLVASGVTLNGTLEFSANAKIKTLIYRGSNTWTVLGG